AANNSGSEFRPHHFRLVEVMGSGLREQEILTSTNIAEPWYSTLAWSQRTKSGEKIHHFLS
ncbi:hypothetical protein CSUI_004612, partial [Cystoisospora suis]